VKVTNTTRSTIVAERVRVARSLLARARGLMLEDRLEHGSGMLIDPCGSIHMFFMRFPLDVLYVDRSDRVVRVQRGIKPWRVGPLHTSGARYVIELPVGTIETSRTEIGDQLLVGPAAS
jgi:uncharacterized membrane protein (UPF0127 family)